MRKDMCLLDNYNKKVPWFFVAVCPQLAKLFIKTQKITSYRGSAFWYLRQSIEVLNPGGAAFNN
jgi:hypothetical protein